MGNFNSTENRIHEDSSLEEKSCAFTVIFNWVTYWKAVILQGISEHSETTDCLGWKDVIIPN